MPVFAHRYLDNLRNKFSGTGLYDDPNNEGMMADAEGPTGSFQKDSMVPPEMPPPPPPQAPQQPLPPPPDNPEADEPEPTQQAPMPPPGLAGPKPPPDPSARIQGLLDQRAAQKAPDAPTSPKSIAGKIGGGVLDVLAAKAGVERHPIYAAQAGEYKRKVADIDDQIKQEDTALGVTSKVQGLKDAADYKKADLDLRKKQGDSLDESRKQTSADRNFKFAIDLAQMGGKVVKEGDPPTPGAVRLKNPTDDSGTTFVDIVPTKGTVKVTDPQLAKDLGVKVGDEVAQSFYLKGLDLGLEREKAKIMAGSKEETPDWKNYQNSKSEGFTGTFEQWQDKDANRKKPAPSGTTVNMINPAALDQAAELYAKTGQMPAMGMGRDGAAIRTSIMNRAAELHGDNDLASAKTDYGATSGAIKNLARQRSQVLTFEKTASKNLDLADSLSQKVDRSGSPVLNRFLLHLKGQYAGDTDTQLLNNAVETAASEYAKIVSGATTGATTDAAREHAREMLTSAMSKGTFSQAVALMKQEMGNRKSGFDEELDSLHGGGKTGAKPSGQSSPVKISNAGEYNALPSGTKYIDPNGNMRTKK